VLCASVESSESVAARREVVTLNVDVTTSLLHQHWQLVPGAKLGSSRLYWNPERATASSICTSCSDENDAARVTFEGSASS
jgi:hypothetical protein